MAAWIFSLEGDIILLGLETVKGFYGLGFRRV